MRKVKENGANNAQLTADSDHDICRDPVFEPRKQEGLAVEKPAALFKSILAEW